MLPFLNQKKRDDASTVVVRPQDEAKKPSSALLGAAHYLLSAIQSNDAEAVAEAFELAFDILDASPHVEGPHIGE